MLFILSLYTIKQAAFPKICSQPYYPVILTSFYHGSNQTWRCPYFSSCCEILMGDWRLLILFSRSQKIERLTTPCLCGFLGSNPIGFLGRKLLLFFLGDDCAENSPIPPDLKNDKVHDGKERSGLWAFKSLHHAFCLLL